MSGFDLGDYVPVAERIVTFYELHPNGRIVCTTPEPVAVNGSYFIGSTCSVWKDATDAPDAVASAWEPFPGKTPYTRDSEAMNAETSAIGRALGAAGIAVKRSLATSDEVQLRQGTPDGVPRAEAKGELVGACHGDTTQAKWWWQHAWPTDPDRVSREELDAIVRVAEASAQSVEGGGTRPEAAPDAGSEEHGGTPTADPSIDEGSPDSVPGNPSSNKAER